MGEEANNFFRAWAIVVASLCYCYFISSKLPKGIFRLISLLPIFSLFTLLPLSLSRPLLTGVLGWFITWLTNFKLILFAFNLGPLPDQNSLFRFILFAAFPIKIKENNNPKFGGHPNKVLPLNFGTKCLIYALLVVVYRHYPNWLVICGLLYFFIDVLFGVCDLIVKGTLGLELDPPSDEPYAATSLQDFWGRRWNRMVSDTLRHTIYEPIRSTAGKLVGRTWAPLPAVMACFVVSGLMHELLYYYAMRVKPTWEVTWFFILHGVCVILEVVVKRSLGQRLRLHWAVSGPLTVGFVMGTGYWLFLPQVVRNHGDVRAVEDMEAFVTFFKELVGVFISF